MRIKHAKAKIDKTQQKIKYSLGVEKDKTINHVLSECSKQDQTIYELGTTGWVKWSTVNCANGINTNQNLSKKMALLKFPAFSRC